MIATTEPLLTPTVSACPSQVKAALFQRGAVLVVLVLFMKRSVAEKGEHIRGE